jgi:hypothetical protein
MTEETDSEQRRVRESADKIRVETQVTRGEETRDQDRLKVKVRGNDPQTVVENMNETVRLLHETADEARSIQPSAGTGEGSAEESAAAD